MPWQWTDDDLGWAYIRFCERDSQSRDSHEKVPANFIKNYTKGKRIDRSYRYKVFLSDGTCKSPTEYLKTASFIPEFEYNIPDESFGETGCYRAFVYTVQDSELELDKWLAALGRIRETPSKLAYCSFDGNSASSSKDIKQQAVSGQKTSKKNSNIGTLKNVESLREQLLASMPGNSQKGAEGDQNGSGSRMGKDKPKKRHSKGKNDDETRPLNEDVQMKIRSRTSGEKKNGPDHLKKKAKEEQFLSRKDEENEKDCLKNKGNQLQKEDEKTGERKAQRMTWMKNKTTVKR